jgi:hypothetical protein
MKLTHKWSIEDGNGRNLAYRKTLAEAVTFLQIHIGAEYRPTRVGAGLYSISSQSSGETWFIERGR